MNGLTLRPATAGDMGEVFQIRTSVTENHLSMAELAKRGITPAWMAHLMTHGTVRMWCAVLDGQVVGFAAVKIDVREVYALFVSPPHQGRGIGSRLLAAAVDYMWQQGRGGIRLATGIDTRAHAFYVNRGWREAGMDRERGDVLLHLDAGPGDGQENRYAGCGGDVARSGPGTPG